MVDLPEDIFRYILDFMPPCLLVHKSGVHNVFRFHPSTCQIQSYDSLPCCITHSSHELVNAVEMLILCRNDIIRYSNSRYISPRAIHFLSAGARQIAYPKLSELVEVTATCCDGKGVMFKLRP